MLNRNTSETGINIKVATPFYKKVKIAATNRELTIKAYIIGLLEKDLGIKYKD